MSDLYNDIVSQRGRLENLVSKIPGFRGYQEQQDRRHADRLLRDYIAGEVQKRVDKLVRIEKIILNNGGMKYMTQTRNVKGKIQLYRDKINAASPGYSGLWAQMKIGPQELEILYSFDEAQIRYVDKLDMALEKLQEAAMKQDGLEVALVELDEVAVEAIEAFSLRDDAINNLARRI